MTFYFLNIFILKNKINIYIMRSIVKISNSAGCGALNDAPCFEREICSNKELHLKHDRNYKFETPVTINNIMNFVIDGHGCTISSIFDVKSLFNLVGVNNNITFRNIIFVCHSLEGDNSAAIVCNDPSSSVTSFKIDSCNTYSNKGLLYIGHAYYEYAEIENLTVRNCRVNPTDMVARAIDINRIVVNGSITGNTVEIRNGTPLNTIYLHENSHSCEISNNTFQSTLSHVYKRSTSNNTSAKQS